MFTFEQVTSYMDKTGLSQHYDAIDIWNHMDSWRRLGPNQMGKPCGRGWVGLRGACQRAKHHGGDKAATLKASKLALADKIRGKRGLKSRELANEGRKARSIVAEPPSKKISTKKAAAKATTSGVKHPTEWKTKEPYQPSGWKAGELGGGMDYSIQSNGYGQFWPNAHYPGENGRNPYPVIIRDSTPFKTFSGATKFVESTIALNRDREKKRNERARFANS